MPRSRVPAAAVAAVAFVLAAVPSAWANGTVSIAADELQVVTDDVGDEFAVTRNAATATLAFTPRLGTTLTDGDGLAGGCTQAGSTVRCPVTGVRLVRITTAGGNDVVRADEDYGLPLVVDLGAGDDRYSARANSAPSDVTAGAGDDGVTTGPATDRLDGGPGGDDLDGGGGFDRYLAGDGADILRARDGRSERVACGEGVDVATTDAIDTPTGCEAVDASAVQQPDQDGDGIEAPADCADADPRRRPGAYDIPGNGVDENCDGGDATEADADRDGFSPPFDCNDASAAQHPRAREIPGNAVDEDCDGVSPPFPRFPSYAILNARIGTVTTITSLAVVDLDGGETIRIRCRGRGCRFATRIRIAGPNADRMVLDRVVRNLRLRYNARLAVDVIRADGVIKTTRYRARIDRSPAQVVRCTTPGDGPIAGC